MSFRVFISSNNLILGDLNDGFYQIKSSGLLHKTNIKYQYLVESFICANTSITSPSLLQILNLPNIDSYSTLSGLNNQTVLTFCTNSFNQIITKNSIGHILNNVDWLINSQLHIKFTNNSGITLTNMNDWTLSLVVFPVKE